MRRLEKKRRKTRVEEGKEQKVKEAFRRNGEVAGNRSVLLKEARRENMVR